jgi:hypothetical protein
MAPHLQRFTETDVNNDGSITKEEAEVKAKEWREKMEERRKARQAEKMKEKAAEDKVEAPATDAPATETPVAE